MLINGEPGNCLDSMDRGLQYGDGLFETIAVRASRPLLWGYHIERLAEGARRLGIPAPDTGLMYREARRAIGDAPHGALKLLLTRGVAEQRGYAPSRSPSPSRIFQFFPSSTPYPQNPLEPVRLRFCDTPLALSPALAGIKHLNRLEQVLARGEWQDRRIFEGLMADPGGDIVEGTMSNLFLVQEGELVTPHLLNGGVAGIMRRVVMESAKSLGMRIREEQVERSRLLEAEALFITNALIGIRPAASLDGVAFDPGKIDKKLIETAHKRAFEAVLENEEPGGMFP